jgi:hypothetical protein
VTNLSDDRESFQGKERKRAELHGYHFGCVWYTVSCERTRELRGDEVKKGEVACS